MTLRAKADAALDELRAVFKRLDDDDVQPLIDALVAARRIALYGAGREGLMMKALTMRLHHLGLDAHVVGDMTTPPLGPGDLLVVSAGPGAVSTVLALMGVARAAGARTACITAQPAGEAPRQADVTTVMPAQTMADDVGADATAAGLSILPMGSLFEGAQYILFELIVLGVRDAIGISAEAMRANHTNLE